MNRAVFNVIIIRLICLNDIIRFNCLQFLSNEWMIQHSKMQLLLSLTFCSPLWCWSKTRLSQCYSRVRVGNLTDGRTNGPEAEMRAHAPTTITTSETMSHCLAQWSTAPSKAFINCNLSLSLSLSLSNPSLRAQIPASSLSFQPLGPHPNLKPQIPTSSLKAQITPSRLKSHYWCSLSSLDPQKLLSIGHRPL